MTLTLTTSPAPLATASYFAASQFGTHFASHLCQEDLMTHSSTHMCIYPGPNLLHFNAKAKGVIFQPITALECRRYRR